MGGLTMYAVSRTEAPLELIKSGKSGTECAQSAYAAPFFFQNFKVSKKSMKSHHTGENKKNKVNRRIY